MNPNTKTRHVLYEKYSRTRSIASFNQSVMDDCIIFPIHDITYIIIDNHILFRYYMEKNLNYNDMVMEINYDIYEKLTNEYYFSSTTGNYLKRTYFKQYKIGCRFCYGGLYRENISETDSQILKQSYPDLEL